MAVTFITRPLGLWPRPETRKRINSPYMCSYERTITHLRREIELLGGTGEAVIQLDLKETEIRNDGLPYARANPRTPRVAIAFTCKRGPMNFYCDAFLTWQENVRGIGLGLQRLRLVEEAGIVSRGEQYAGFKALPGAIPLGPATLTPAEAAAAMAKLGGLDASAASRLTLDYEYYKTMYRRLVHICHPDKAPNLGDDFRKLQACADLLDRFHEERGRK